jgi:oxygen-dependent protoporphyrinogen oxidase
VGTSADVAVVGGGVSGLVAALRLATAGARVVVLEQGDRLGGVLRLGEVAGAVVDLGAESLLARRPEAVDLVREVGLGGDLVHPATARAAVWSRGALHPMPTGTLMGVPSDPEALAGLLTDDEVARVRAEVLAPAADDDVSVADLVAARLGAAVVERLVDPLLGGVYAGRAEALSLRATVPALWPAARDGGSLVGAARAAAAAGAAASGPVFAGVRGGVGRLPGALAERIREAGGTIRTGACVQEVGRRGSGWSLSLGPAGRGDRLDVDGVVLAVPGPAAARLLAGPAPAAAERLRAVRVASLALVTAVLPAGTLDAAGEELSGVLVPAVEGRLVKAMTFATRKWDWVREAAGGRDVLRVSVGRAGEVAPLQRPDDDLAAAALADAADLLGTPLPAEAVVVTRWGGGLPQYDVGHLDLVAAVRADLAAAPGLAVAGSVWGGVGVPACVATADAAAADLLARLG